MKTHLLEETKKVMKGVGMEKITPFIWFNDNAEEAVNFYTSIFQKSALKNVTRYGEEGPETVRRPKGSVMTVGFQIEGQTFTAINGGPVFEINPSISFFVSCDTPQETDLLWEKLSAGGTVMMDLDKYPFSDKYGWIQDRYGVSWQLMLSGRKQKIAPCLMFAGEQHKKAEQAIGFYTSVFENSDIIQLEHYTADTGPEGAVVHAKFVLNGQEFIAMDAHMEHPVTFNPGVSLVVHCDSQEEVDYYWTKLSEGGDERAQQCGWLMDKFGVSWQVVPTVLLEYLNDTDQAKAQRVMQTMLKMKKIDISLLKRAYLQA